MKITLVKPHALNGELLAAGTHELPDASAQKLIEKKIAVPAAEGAEPVAKKTRKPRSEDPAAN